MDRTRLEKQLSFIFEIDKIKNIVRKTKLFDRSRFENDAEHSWTVCMMALVLKEYADFDVDISRVIWMLLIHDVIEVYSGDTFLYAAERDNVREKEEAAAEKIFGMLDRDQYEFFLGLWHEFEDRETNEAKFAAVFDRLEPLLQNYRNHGETWKANGITRDMVNARNCHIADGSKELWKYIEEILDECMEKGFLNE